MQLNSPPLSPSPRLTVNCCSRYILAVYSYVKSHTLSLLGVERLAGADSINQSPQHLRRLLIRLNHDAITFTPTILRHFHAFPSFPSSPLHTPLRLPAFTLNHVLSTAHPSPDHALSLLDSGQSGMHT